ncbi:hypothetical protein Taro_027389 [Colocasia esculenta]|uniref:CCHC-type domain-containing protein n=1 Tax=Colocasia esculenta TaxID=4460 RepID=A0A843VED6_COLES|nr:hypothetical protein [Colocasia esculenta]
MKRQLDHSSVAARLRVQIQQAKREQFETLQQGNLSVLEYQMRFMALSRTVEKAAQRAAILERTVQARQSGGTGSFRRPQQSPSISKGKAPSGGASTSGFGKLGSKLKKIFKGRGGGRRQGFQQGEGFRPELEESQQSIARQHTVPPEYRCYNCDQPGHLIRNCPYPRRRNYGRGAPQQQQSFQQSSTERGARHGHAAMWPAGVVLVGLYSSCLIEVDRQLDLSFVVARLRAGEKPRLRIFSYYASGKNSGEPAEQIAEATPNIPTEAIHPNTRQFARRNRQLGGQAGTSGQAPPRAEPQHEGIQVPFFEESNIQIEEGGLPTSTINSIIDLPTRENFQAMSDDDKYQVMQQWQSKMAMLRNEMRRLATSSLRQSMESISIQNQQQNQHLDGSTLVNHSAASTSGLLPQVTGQDIIDPSNTMPPQTGAMQVIAIQRHMIQKIIEDIFAQQGEGIWVADLYSVPYLVHHQLKKLPLECPKVPKLQKFDGQGSPLEHLAHYTTAMGDLALEESYLLRYFATSLTGAFQWYSKLKSNSVAD